VTARRGIPFVVAAPSGTGKTTVCRALVEGDDQLVFSVSHTTRARREGEHDGIDYHFVSDREFEELVERGAFLEWAVYNDRRYGTSHAALDEPLARGKDVLLEIEVQGAAQVRARRADARMVFLLPPSLASLAARLRGRGTDGEDEIARRLRVARREIEAAELFDYRVVNDDLARCVEDLRRIVRAERAGAAAALRAELSGRDALARLRSEAAGA